MCVFMLLMRVSTCVRVSCCSGLLVVLDGGLSSVCVRHSRVVVHLLEARVLHSSCNYTTLCHATCTIICSTTRVFHHE